MVPFWAEHTHACAHFRPWSGEGIRAIFIGMIYLPRGPHFGVKVVDAVVVVVPVAAAAVLPSAVIVAQVQEGGDGRYSWSFPRLSVGVTQD